MTSVTAADGSSAVRIETDDLSRPEVHALLEEHLRDGAGNLNMVTCGGQATIPIVNAVSRVTEVQYAEIVASIASKSAGPGTRANIDEFTETTSAAIVQVGGAKRGRGHDGAEQGGAG